MNARDSHPLREASWGQLAEEQLQREFASTLVGNGARHGGLRNHHHARQLPTPRPSSAVPSRSRSFSQSSPIGARGSDVSEYGLDFNVDNTHLSDEDFEKPQLPVLGNCDLIEHEHLEDEIERLRDDMRTIRDEHEQQFEVAQIDVERLEEELQEREDTLFDLQQQLDESKSQHHGFQNDDIERLNDANQRYLAQIDSLNEQLLEANERIADGNKTLASLRAGSQNPKQADAGFQALIHTENDLEEQLAACRTDRAEDADAAAQDMNRLRARITFLEAVTGNAREEINDSTVADDVGDVNQQKEKERVVDHIGEIEALIQRLATAQRDLGILEVRDAEHEQEIEQYKEEVAQLSAMVTTLNSRLHSRLDALRSSSDGRLQADHQFDDEAGLDERIQALIERVTARDLEIAASQDTSSDLRRRLSQATNQLIHHEQELGGLRSTKSALEEVIANLTGTQEGQVREMAMLRDDLQAAKDKLGRYQGGPDVDDKFDDSGFFEAGTPVEPDELPRAKRFRSLPPEVDVEYECQADEDLDDLISPSSFVESEPSPLLPRLRRSGRTRIESQRLSTSVNESEDEEEAQFRRVLAAVAPADQRGLVAVISRGDTAAANKSAGRSTALKRKRRD